MDTQLIEQYQECLQNIRNSCIKRNRSFEDVKLIAVSKTKPVEDILTLYNAGCRDFGENKVQELVDKYQQLPKDIHWHMIGHLQRNKVKYIIDKVCLIHSVDSLELAEEINKQAAKHNLVMNILIEVNVANEESKFGLHPNQVEDFIYQVANFRFIKVVGLMTVAPYVDISEENRQYFVSLCQLLVDINSKNIDNITIDSLSMGMTNDYEIAIEEGATMVRIGSGIFGDRIYHQIS